MRDPATTWHRKPAKIPTTASPTHSNDSFHLSLHCSELSNFSMRPQQKALRSAIRPCRNVQITWANACRCSLLFRLKLDSSLQCSER